MGIVARLSRIIKYFIEIRKANINEKDNKGLNILMMASLQGHLKIVKYLIEEKKSEINKKNYDEWNNLINKTTQYKLEIEKYLQTKKKNNIKSKYKLNITSNNFTIVKENTKKKLINNQLHLHSILFL